MAPTKKNATPPPPNAEDVLQWMRDADVPVDEIAEVSELDELSPELLEGLKNVGKVYRVGGEGDDYRKTPGGDYVEVKVKESAKYANVYLTNYWQTPEGKTVPAAALVLDDVIPFSLFPPKEGMNPYGTFDRRWNGDATIEVLRKLTSLYWQHVSEETQNPGVRGWNKKKGLYICETHKSEYSDTCEDKAKRGKPRETPIAHYKLKFKGGKAYQTKLLNAEEPVNTGKGLTFEPFRVNGEPVNEWTVHEVIKRGATAKAAIYDFSSSTLSSAGLSNPVELRMAILDLSTAGSGGEIDVESLGLDLSEYAAKAKAPAAEAAAPAAAEPAESAEAAADESMDGVDAAIAAMAIAE